MSRFTGPQPGTRTERPNGSKRPKGIVREHRASLREQAEKRNKETDPKKRKEYRREQARKKAAKNAG